MWQLWMSTWDSLKGHGDLVLTNSKQVCENVETQRSGRRSSMWRHTYFSIVHFTQSSNWRLSVRLHTGLHSEHFNCNPAHLRYACPLPIPELDCCIYSTQTLQSADCIDLALSNRCWRGTLVGNSAWNSKVKKNASKAGCFFTNTKIQKHYINM